MMNRPILLLTLGCLVFAGFACGTPETPTTGTTPTGTTTPASPTSPAKTLSAFNVEWLSHQIPSEMQAAKSYRATITLKNTTTATWPTKGDPPGPVFVSYHWLPAQGDQPVVFDGERTAFPHDITPGEVITLDKVAVLAPPNPGSYRLQVSLVQEGITWFDTQGVPSLTVPVTVR